MNRVLAICVLTVLSAAAPAATATSFFDGFEGEAPAGSVLNYASFVNWAVTGGAVDLVKSGDFGITCRSGSFCVDLDGSTGDPGLLTLATPIAIASGDTVELSAWFSHNQRNSNDDVVAFRGNFDVPVDLVNFQFIVNGIYLPTDDASGISIISTNFNTVAIDPSFKVYGFRFTALNATALTLTFEDLANLGADNVGVILDDVSVTITPVPEPATWAMMIGGFGLVSAGLRSRRQRGVFA